MTLGNGQPKPAGTWDWYGELDPAHEKNHGYHTFSIGVFQWVPKWDGKKTKKGKSVKRFSAPIHAPEEAYSKARAFIAAQVSATEEPA